MASFSSPSPSSRSGLLLRDGLTFFALCGVTIVLFLITLVLFRSFEAHREVIGERWAARGEAALRAGQPAQAVTALRTALTFRDTEPERLRLAEALAEAGSVDEAFNYFQTLRETRPGDGFINLQLARLSRRRGDADEAIDFYRTAILGNWEGDGTLRRREARLELAKYLAQRGQGAAARNELLIAVGNTPENAVTDALFADQLESMGDAQDALELDRKSLALQAHQPNTLAKAGRLAYSLGDYSEAAKWLFAALREKPGTGEAESDNTKQLAAMLANARRIPELNMARDLPATERAEHLLLAAGIAQARLRQCATLPNGSDGSVQVLKGQWAALAGRLKRRFLERDALLADEVMQLVFATELQMAHPGQQATSGATACGAPTGDDELLLMLAQKAKAGP